MDAGVHGLVHFFSCHRASGICGSIQDFPEDRVVSLHLAHPVVSLWRNVVHFDTLACEVFSCDSLESSFLIQGDFVWHSVRSDPHLLNSLQDCVRVFVLEDPHLVQSGGFVYDP